VAGELDAARQLGRRTAELLSRARGPRSREPLFPKLKPGPGQPPEKVEANQRVRLHAAMVESVSELGYPSVKVRPLAGMAGVSTRTLYRRFGSVEGCFAATYDSLTHCALLRTAAAARAGGKGEPGLRAGLRELARMFIEQPKEARLILVDAYAAGPAMRLRIRAAEAEFARLLATTLAAVPTDAAVSPRLAHAMVAGLEHVARRQLRAGLPLADDGVRIADRLTDWVLSSAGCPASAGCAPRRSVAHGRRRSLGAVLGGEVGDARVRILTATLRLGASEGYAALTVPRIRAEAAVSRRRFDEHFDGVEDCFLSAIEALALAVLAAAECLDDGAGGQPAIERAAAALCAEAARSLPLARLAFVEILVPGLAGLRRRQRLIDIAAARLRAASPPDRRPAQIAQAASVAAAWQLLATELDASRGEDLPRLAPTLAYVVTSCRSCRSSAASA